MAHRRTPLHSIRGALQAPATVGLRLCPLESRPCAPKVQKWFFFPPLRRPRLGLPGSTARRAGTGSRTRRALRPRARDTLGETRPAAVRSRREAGGPRCRLSGSRACVLTLRPAAVPPQLEEIQSRLFDAGSAIATPSTSSSERKVAQTRFDADAATRRAPQCARPCDRRMAPADLWAAARARPLQQHFTRLSPR